MMWSDIGAVLAKCDVVVATDSPMLSLAGAVKNYDKDQVDPPKATTPLVGIFGPVLAKQRIQSFENAVGITAQVVCTGCQQSGPGQCRVGFPSPCYGTIDSGTISDSIIKLGALTTDKLKEEHKVSVDQWSQQALELIKPVPSTPQLV